MRWITILCVIVGVAWIASADTPVTPTPVRYGCDLLTLCSAEADTTAACDDGTDNYVARVAGYAVQTLAASSSTATSFSCHLFANDSGYSATARQQITSVPLSTAQYVVTVEGPMDYEWIECSAITGGTVTIKSLACRDGR